RICNARAEHRFGLTVEAITKCHPEPAHSEQSPFPIAERAGEGSAPPEHRVSQLETTRSFEVPITRDDVRCRRSRRSRRGAAPFFRHFDANTATSRKSTLGSPNLFHWVTQQIALDHPAISLGHARAMISFGNKKPINPHSPGM